MNRITFLALRGVEDGPGHFARLRSVARLHPIGAGPRQRNVAQQQCGLVLAVLAFDEGCGLAERGGVVGAVDRDLDLRRVGAIGEFDFEVKTRAGQNVGAVDRIDGLGAGGNDGNRHGGGKGQRAHGSDPCSKGWSGDASGTS
jgi:hypothetical protein